MKGEKVENKKIQRVRKKRYFIDATKNLIEEIGVEALTVKKIALTAGYATGTLYNYFDNLNVLLFHCILDYFEELYSTLSDVQLINEDYEEYLLDLMAVYTDYFTQKPEIYYLIYLKNLGSVEEINDGKIFRPKISMLLKKALIEYYNSRNILKEHNELAIIGSLISNSLHGNLLFYINKKSNISVEELKEKIKNEVMYIVKIGEK
jgi:AcrR family transcriptional regulator